MPEQADSLIGFRCGEQIVVIERGPAANLASTLRDHSPEYRDERAAVAAGFPAVPAPPTYPFVMQSWGVRAELLDRYGVMPAPATEFGELAGQLGPIGTALEHASRILGSGLLLHGEQEFVYHRTPLAGDVLRGETTVVDVRRKPSRDRELTFIVVETRWSGADTGDPVVTSRFTAVHQPPRTANPR